MDRFWRLAIGVVWLGAGVSAGSRANAAGGSLTVDVTAVRGYRTANRIRIGSGRSLEIGISNIDTTVVAYASYDGAGLVRSFRVGNLVLQLGERVLLGRRFGSYPLAAERTVPDGLRVAPSLSRFFGRMGASIGIGHRGFELKTTVFDGRDGGSIRSPNSLWMSADFSGDRWRAGLTYGAESGSAHAVVSIHARVRTAGTECSGELACFAGGSRFGAVRSRWTSSRARGSVLFFHVPSLPSSAIRDMRPDEGAGFARGARLDHHVRLSRVRLSMSLVLGERRTPDGGDAFRRAALTIARRGRAVLEWQASVLLVREYETSLPAAPLTVVTRARSTRVRVRWRARFANTARLTHYLRIDYEPDAGGCGQGVLLSAGSTLAGGRIEVRWTATAYDLPVGAVGFVTRPAMGPFESFAAVYGKGSDVALRARWRLVSGLSLLGYFGSPWLRRTRAYVGVQYEY